MITKAGAETLDTRTISQRPIYTPGSPMGGRVSKICATTQGRLLPFRFFRTEKVLITSKTDQDTVGTPRKREEEKEERQISAFPPNS